MSKFPKFWILDGKTPKSVDLYTWAAWFEDDDRHVARTVIDEDVVSTVFLGIDHSMGGPEPLLFETMIFVGPGHRENWCERCTTWDQALDQHAEALTELKMWHENAAKQVKGG